MPADPCAELARLRELRTAIITGRAESQVRFGDEEVRYSPANLPALDREIARLEAECSGRRTRYAKRIQFG